MAFISGKHIPRRTFLHGMGATVALPFLDAMIPAGRLWRAEEINNTRLVCIEEVHGTAGCNEWGASQYLYAPEKLGRDFTMAPASALKPFEPFQDYLTVVSNTDCRMAESFTAPEIGGDHFRSTAVLLTQAHPKQTQGSDIYVGTSLDQIYAQRYGQDTPMPSMQLCIEPTDQAGGCWYNYHCAYTDALSWSSPTQPLPVIRDPRVAFDRLFGAGGTPEERAIRRRTNRSILDWVTEEVSALKRRVGSQDAQRVEQLLENVREVERRIELTEQRNSSGEGRELPEAPTGVPDSYSEHMEMMFDIQVLAFEMDLTRVISLKTGRDASSRIFPESGMDKPFHAASHYGSDPEAISEFNDLCRYRMSTMVPFLEKLKNTVEGDTHLLDKTVVLWGSAISDSNIHAHRRCPLIFLGRGNGVLEGNLHVKAPDGTPMANAMLTLMHELGLDDLESFGDSTGELSLRQPRAAMTASDGLGGLG